MSQEIIEGIQAIEKEKGIEEGVLITALEDALRAGIDILQSLRAYNEERAAAARRAHPKRNSVHEGQTRVDIVDDSWRMQGDSISGEVGVGAGTDHLQWARAGALCHGVDLTDAAIETTRARLAHYGFTSELRRVDAETLPFPDDTFDVVWSWGVIHHC
jgi:2-polyprenyl-3-methyl-5-hydroxy-6-metoxy-1,4-benzoquinol methylase